MQHIPVLQHEVINILNPKSGEVVADVTLGIGGHAKAFLEKIGKKGKLIGLDADEKNIEEAAKILKGANVTIIRENFRNLPSIQNLQGLHILFADLGLSSPHIDDPNRGFSFREESPLDCRFDQSQGQSASALLMQESEEELAAIFKEYGELERAHLFARAIVAGRAKAAIKTTSDLVAIAEEIYKWKTKKHLPKIFQALRIAVNDEIGALKSLLEHGPGLLKPGGRMGVISYHSLEDRLVKRRFRELTTAPKDAMTGANLTPASYELLTKKAVQATLEEIENNPRARSARFRVIRKM